MIAPWQIWWADFDPQVGREQAGDRPAIIVGTTLACAIPNSLALLVPCTRTDRQLPWQPRVMLDPARPSFAMCDQIKALSTQRLRSRHPGVLSDNEISAVAFALRQLIIVTDTQPASEK